MSGNIFIPSISRRTFLRAGAALAAFGPGMQLFSGDAHAADKVVIQFDWLISNGQIGDVVALSKGYFEEAGLAVEFSPGGPNSATVPPVISGSAQLGQFSETPQLYAARASGVPVKIFACGFRTGPYALTSKPGNAIRTVADLKGKKIGIQPTARFAMDAVAAKNGIDINDMTIINVGFDKAPLVRGEVDAIGGWITNTQALSVVGEDRVDVLLSDLGLKSYANVYFATDAALDQNPELLARYLRAAAKGWEWTHANPQAAVETLVEAQPEIDKEWELKTIDLINRLSFDADTARDGWATFDPASIEEQIAIFDEIGQYPSGRPALEDVQTTAILEMTAADRPKLDRPA
jgi:NitT/TauT family transport system substrate-binding protein